MTIFLLGFTVLISAFLLYRQEYFSHFIFRPSEFWKGKKVYTIFSSGFAHADWGHLAFNMITLYFFGDNLKYIYENFLGESGAYYYLLFYLAALVIANLPDLFQHRHHQGFASLGASGAVSAVVFSVILFFPTQTIYVYFIPIPSILYALLFVSYSLFAGKLGWQSQINHTAHLFGALFGLLATIIFFPQSLEIFWKAIQSWIS